MYDNTDIENIKQNLLGIGDEGREIWKKAVISDKQIFDQLYQLIFMDDKHLAWRSCWIIDNASEESPDLLADKIPEIITALLSTNNTSLKRHFTRILCRYQIPSEYLSAVVDKSFELLSPSEPAAVRVFAMQLLFNITRELPDLKGELICVIESLMDEGGSAGFINRSVKLLRKLRS
ncbi:MAG TPA: hypothetical protein VGK38_14145 [Prolixibacteraceae bacterium]